MAWSRKRKFSISPSTNYDHMSQIWSSALPEFGLCSREEVGDSAVVESLVPLTLEDLCEELIWGHQGFHWS